MRRWINSGRSMGWCSAISTTSRWVAGWHRRWVNWRAKSGGSRIRWSARTRLAAQFGHDRQIWHKRFATPPAAYAESACCRAPLLPLLTRDVRESGLICQHCSETLVPFDELPGELATILTAWSAEYEPIHAVAHWDDRQRKSAGNYDRAYEQAAQQAERLLARAGHELAPKLLEHFPAIIWEDQDECLEVRPEDVRP